MSLLEKKDLAIHKSKSVDDPAGVISEVKNMTNRQEMHPDDTCVNLSKKKLDRSFIIQEGVG